MAIKGITMSKVTIFTIIAFVVALFSFFIYDYIEGTVQDTMIDATGQAVTDSPIDSASKTSILSTFTILKVAGFIGTIGGIALLVKKHF